MFIIYSIIYNHEFVYYMLFISHMEHLAFVPNTETLIDPHRFVLKFAAHGHKKNLPYLMFFEVLYRYDLIFSIIFALNIVLCCHKTDISEFNLKLFHICCTQISTQIEWRSPVHRTNCWLSESNRNLYFSLKRRICVNNSLSKNHTVFGHMVIWKIHFIIN